MLVAALSVAAEARAVEPIAYTVRARVRREAGQIDAHLSVRVRVAEGEDHVTLWLYPDRLAVAPSAMEERSARWIYPGEIDRGRLRVHDVTVDRRPLRARYVRRPRGDARARDMAGSDLVVPIAAGPGREIVIELDFALRVPDRFGRLGRDDGLLSLAAPWYPLVIGPDDAWWYDVPQRIEVVCDDGAVWSRRAIERESTIEARGPYVPLSFAAQWHAQTRRAAGTSIVLHTPNRLYEPPDPSVRGEEGLIDLARVDVGALVHEVAADVITSARVFGLRVPPRIDLVQIPSRTELVANAPGVVLFSDRLFQIFPIEQTLQFHRRALRRALFAHLVAAQPTIDPPSDRGWATDLRAVVLLDLDELRRQRTGQSPQELLGLFAFHPAVDQLLYAPQIAFEDAYFAAIEERDPFRDDPVRARIAISRGRRLLESARDALTEPQMTRFVELLAAQDRSVRDALAIAAPDRIERLPLWLRATRSPLNYRLGAIRSTATPTGYRHEVEVLREGDLRPEPVEVAVHDTAGHVATAVWDAPGERGVVTIETPQPLGGATIDPRHRLPQDPALADGHPRIDDATDQPWRPPILNAFVIDLFVTEALFTGEIDFALRRRYDLEHTVALRVERTAALTGGNLRYLHGVGPKVHTNRRIGLIGGGVSFERLHEFFAESGIGGWRGQLFATASLNTVSFALDPRDGAWLSGRLVGGVAVRDDGSVTGTMRGGVRGGVIVPLGVVNALALIGGGGFTWGDALPSELQGLGGRSVLRGYESGELLGSGVVYGVVEHRYTAVRDLAWNVAHLVWVRELQLAAFVGGGLVFDPAGNERDVDGAVEAGGGVRFHYEYGGVQPGVVAIDLGVPLYRRSDLVIVDGEVVRRRAPVGFYVSFDQYF